MRKKKSQFADVSPARKAAFDVLMAVERGRSHADELLRGKTVSKLGHADRNLATALVLGVLRWQSRLDEEIKTFLKRPGGKLDAEIRVVLRMGTFQLLFLDRVPAHAAIDESVELAKRTGHRFAAGMVNAVLRKIGRGRAEQSFGDFNVLEQDFIGAYPAWMVHRWTRFFGAQAAFGICRYGQQPPRLALRLADAPTEAELAAEGVRLEPAAMLTSSRIITAGDVTATAAFREGRVRIQDEGSQLVGEITACAGEMDGRKPERILDLCAAPGGKTLILAERNAEARILACEANPARLAKLRERLAALGERVECRLTDAAALDGHAEFDVVLADVPCSGTGTLGRNPEIRHRLHEKDLARQAERQWAILRAALRAVRPGGRVVYSTCSLEPEENEDVVRAVLAEHAEARVVPLSACIEGLESRGVLAAGPAERLRGSVTPEGMLRLMPEMFGTDGFFVTLLKRGV